jgi:hypothetical protein
MNFTPTETIKSWSIKDHLSEKLLISYQTLEFWQSEYRQFTMDMGFSRQARRLSTRACGRTENLMEKENWIGNPTATREISKTDALKVTEDCRSVPLFSLENLSSIEHKVKELSNNRIEKSLAYGKTTS